MVMQHDRKLHVSMISSSEGPVDQQGQVINYKEGGGWLQNCSGRHVKFYPYKNGGAKSFAHAEGGGGGHTKVWGSFYMGA